MAEPSPKSELPDWAGRFFASSGLTSESTPGEILREADFTAGLLAPDTRRLWKWILGLQGAAVLVPMLWFFVLRAGLPVSLAATSMVLCAILVVGICWWLRWRGMQTGWTQARMIAEIARSAVATQNVSPKATVQALAGAPELHQIARYIINEAPVAEPDREGYLKNRVHDQRDYYLKKLEESIDTRHQLSRYVTLSLDGTLFLAVAGLVLALNSGAERWLRLSGSDLVIGVVGAALPLCAILLQMLGSYLELNRRTGRFSQQEAFLKSAEARLEDPENSESAEKIAIEVERELLGEVIEWFFQSKHAEPYYRARPHGLEKRTLATLARPNLGWGRRTIAWMGLGASFVGRVVFGRLLVAAISVIVTTALIAFYSPKDYAERSILRREDGRLLSSPEADGWEPDPERAAKGFIMIAHGLHDGVKRIDADEEEPHWMGRLQRALEARLGDDSPEICLVDWHYAATPIHSTDLRLESSTDQDRDDASLPTTPAGWLQDVVAIRSQGEEIGDLVGYKIARAIREGEIRQDRPMHFIGHSAGGFVVLRAAMVLQDLGLASKDLKVTMLDTPLPVVAELEKFLADFPIDYVCTSTFAQGVPDNEFLPGFFRLDVPEVEGIDRYLGAHSYAHKWYIDSVSSDAGEDYKDGFARSPFTE